MLIRRTLIALFLIGSAACRPNANLPQGQYYSPRTAALQMKFPGLTNDKLEYDQFGNYTKKTYRRQLEKIAPGQKDKLLFYSHTVDFPEKTPYTGLGNLISNLDTAALKRDGFVNRRINNQPYLHKRGEDLARKIVTSEFVVKVDSGYFYLFSFAPIRRLLPNEEDVIIAQDSLTRKHSAIIGSFRKK